jgi:hypothetical protein
MQAESSGRQLWVCNMALGIEQVLYRSIFLRYLLLLF